MTLSTEALSRLLIGLATQVRPAPEARRKSSSAITDEDKEKALQFRKNALKTKGQFFAGYATRLPWLTIRTHVVDIDLAAIARTSAAVSTSPPSAIPIMSDADVSLYLLVSAQSHLTTSYSDHEVNHQ